MPVVARLEEHCPGCGVALPVEHGPTHPYIGASAACWRLYGEVLARGYRDPAYRSVHQLAVDAYAAQHPGRREPRAAQSVSLHLVTLCLALEDGVDGNTAGRLHARLASGGSFAWLEPPDRIGMLTVADVVAARDVEAHVSAVEAWARDVWNAWSPHHRAVRALIRERLG